MPSVQRVCGLFECLSTSRHPRRLFLQPASGSSSTTCTTSQRIFSCRSCISFRCLNQAANSRLFFRECKMGRIVILFGACMMGMLIVLDRARCRRTFFHLSSISTTRVQRAHTLPGRKSSCRSRPCRASLSYTVRCEVEHAFF